MRHRTKDPNKRGSRGLRGPTRDRTPAQPGGAAAATTAPGGSARSVGMTVSESRPPGPPGREARSPRRRLALPLPQCRGGRPHATGSDETRTAAETARGQPDSCSDRRVRLRPSEAGEWERAPTRVGPPPQACSYSRAAAAAEPGDRPPRGATAARGPARRVVAGLAAGRPPSVMPVSLRRPGSAGVAPAKLPRWPRGAWARRVTPAMFPRPSDVPPPRSEGERP